MHNQNKEKNRPQLCLTKSHTLFNKENKYFIFLGFLKRAILILCLTKKIPPFFSLSNKVYLYISHILRNAQLYATGQDRQIPAESKRVKEENNTPDNKGITNGI